MAIFNGWRITRTGVVFVIGVVVLAGLVFGGIWMVRDRGEQARRQEAVKIAEQNLENQSNAPAARDDSTTSSTDVAKTDTTKTATTTTKVPTATTTTATSTSTQLPETGADSFTIVIVALLALAGSYYVTSRRAVREL
ncbi:MAG: LPXTG cell wall anchor domain-containing protein [Candidatus Saccharimonadales bacterium]